MVCPKPKTGVVSTATDLFTVLLPTVLLSAVASHSAIITHDRNVFNQAFLEPHCYYQTDTCQPLNTTSQQCLDVTLPYRYTSTPNFDDLTTNDINLYLSRWKGLRSIPQCWKALQSILCASFFPRCDNDNKRVILPNHEMCRFIRGPCRLIEMHYEWPDFLRCDNETLFPQNCKNVYTDLKFNTSAMTRCVLPLVNTDDTNIWYPGIDGCALQCYNPIYSKEEHRGIEYFIYYLAITSLIFNSFAVATFIIDWKSSNRYPPVIIFYLNTCFLISDVGWLLQFMKGKEEIVCRSDNTVRYSEPGTPENFYCILAFLLTYYFSMAASVWFVNLAYAWDLSFQKSFSQRNLVNSKVAYFHLSAWSVPLMLTLTILALGEIDGDSLRGICFVGFVKPIMRIFFILIPITLSLSISCFYLFKAMNTLIQVKSINKAHSPSRNSKISSMIERIAIFAAIAILTVTCTYISHIYEFLHLPKWKKSLEDYILCSLNITSALYPYSDLTEKVECKAKERPNLLIIYIQLASFFAMAIATSTWVFTGPSWASWKRFLSRRCYHDPHEPTRLKRHEMISKLFNRRHQFSQGCYTPKFHSIHNDPVGMNLTSAASQDLSSTWTAAFPNFIYRRGGISDIATDNHYLPHFAGTRHSSMSDISQHKSFDSYASQRLSLDSQVSLEQELAAIARHQRRKTKKERERLLKAHNNHRALPYKLPRRGSDTSGSVISSAFIARIPRNAQTETKSTSTGDLISLVSPLAFPIHPIYPGMVHSSNNFPPASVPFSPVNIVARQRPVNSSISNFTFTHGMSDQSHQLTNPLNTKRRPESSTTNQTPTPQAQRTTPNPNLIQQVSQFTPNSFSNFGLSYLNNANYSSPGLNNYYNMINANPFFANMHMPTPPANGHIQNYPNFLPGPYPTTPIPGMNLLPQQFPFQGIVPHYPYSNIEELQNITRERDAYIGLILPMDSASEMGDALLPIQISDSEGPYTDGVISRNEGIQATQQIVDSHIQKIEAAVEADSKQFSKLNGESKQTVVGSMGEELIGEVLEMKQLKNNKTEKKKKKRSSSRKSKSVNNNVETLPESQINKDK